MANGGETSVVSYLEDFKDSAMTSNTSVKVTSSGVAGLFRKRRFGSFSNVELEGCLSGCSS